ncbi:UNVERIFIED_CONTAM: hypothetical protein Scaly_1904800 [Sesamum calycinum]|uniref:RING-type domain-containing protein n=1 Tax=Sesamum calycinum TaxID=2727403 RepID=A0AAW2NEF9_9LAMI
MRWRWRWINQLNQGMSASSDDGTLVMIIEVLLERYLHVFGAASYIDEWNNRRKMRIIFFPLWLFHVVVARGRFSLPAPSVPHDRHNAIASTIASDLFSMNVSPCCRMCKALLPGDDESMTDDAIWETLPHFWVAISMVFFLAATVFTLLKLCGDVGALGWWDLFINYGIAECFAFLVCTKWSNPVIHRNSRTREESSSSTAIRYLDWNSGLVVSSEDHSQDRMCGLQDIGGHIMKIPVIGFQILLCMRLEGTPIGARHIPLPVLFSPIFLLQGAGVLFATSRLIEKIVLLLRSEASEGIYFVYSSRIRDCFDFLHHGSRLLGWWSIDETSREEQARLFHDGASGYNTFSGYPPEIVKKMPKKDLAEEVWRLQAALGEQTEITKFSQQEYERLQHEKVLCRVCFEGEITIVLLPCRHRILCSSCSDKCKKCPICRVPIEERLPVYDV